MRLIDADDVQNMIDIVGTVNGILCDDVRRFIDSIPTVKPEQKRGGGWIFHAEKHGYLWKCSACGGNSEARFAFCPFCGVQHWG